MKKYKDQILALCKEAEACMLLPEPAIKKYTFCLFMELADQMEDPREWTEEEVDGAFEYTYFILEIIKPELERDIDMLNRLALVYDGWKGSFMFAAKMSVK